MLYVGTGDGGGGGDPHGSAATRRTSARLLGKILRIDPRQPAAGRYRDPADNPFVGPRAARGRRSTRYGLRNPWRFSFDRATGDL